ncbi:nuclear transport factor 2 family protein [Ekhidna sp. MALMAid0563]|uniref:YybH family protein n=1 Tax=Ekhidna sp. MALMAid0563 TaxID=3143937 RepID=UPI0032DF1789
MRIILTILTLTIFSYAKAQEKEVESIKSQAKKFSEYMMNGEREQVVAMYTSDAKIFPADRDILEGERLANYWNPPGERSWKTSYHRITPVEIKVMGNEAYDWGYYEGTSSNGEQTSDWRGKYVIIWRKIEGEWKIYLDIWNRIKLDN